MWGNGSQCGHGDNEDVESPKPLGFFANTRVTSFSCGGYHTVCTTEENNGVQGVYSWGSGTLGELGNGDVT